MAEMNNLFMVLGPCQKGQSSKSRSALYVLQIVLSETAFLQFCVYRRVPNGNPVPIAYRTLSINRLHNGASILLLERVDLRKKRYVGVHSFRVPPCDPANSWEPESWAHVSVRLFRCFLLRHENADKYVLDITASPLSRRGTSAYSESANFMHSCFIHSAVHSALMNPFSSAKKEESLSMALLHPFAKHEEIVEDVSYRSNGFAEHYIRRDCRFSTSLLTCYLCIW